MTFIYLLFSLITVITQQKDSSILHWIILILALKLATLNLHIFEFSQFRTDLIAPINFDSRRTSPWSPQVSAALTTSSPQNSRYYRSLAGGATSPSAITVNKRWMPHMILTEARCSFPDIPNMECTVAHYVCLCCLFPARRLCPPREEGRNRRLTGGKKPQKTCAGNGRLWWNSAMKPNFDITCTIPI